MLKTLFFLIILVLFSSCKLASSNRSREISGVGAISANEERNFTALEAQIGKRICSSIKKKREFFSSLTNEKEEFRLRSELRDCNYGITQDLVFDASISNINPIGLEYISSVSGYLKDIVTDQSVVLKQICDDLAVTDSTLNTLYMGNVKFSVNFLIADGFDRYEVVKSKKNANSKYIVESAEGISFFTQKNQVQTKFFGVEKDRILYTACDASHYSVNRQTWLAALTSF
jgi:hypothetical protein